MKSRGHGLTIDPEGSLPALDVHVSSAEIYLDWSDISSSEAMGHVCILLLLALVLVHACGARGISLDDTTSQTTLTSAVMPKKTSLNMISADTGVQLNVGWHLPRWSSCASE